MTPSPLMLRLKRPSEIPAPRASLPGHRRTDDVRDELGQGAERFEMQHLAGRQMLGPPAEWVLDLRSGRKLHDEGAVGGQVDPRSAELFWHWRGAYDACPVALGVGDRQIIV